MSDIRETIRRGRNFSGRRSMIPGSAELAMRKLWASQGAGSIRFSMEHTTELAH